MKTNVVHKNKPTLKSIIALSIAVTTFTPMSIVHARAVTPEVLNMDRALILNTKAGNTTVGKFLNDVLPHYQDSQWLTPISLPGESVVPLIYSEDRRSSGGWIASYLLFTIKNKKVRPDDVISQAIMSGHFATAYAMMLSASSGANKYVDSNGISHEIYTSVAPIVLTSNKNWSMTATSSSKSIYGIDPSLDGIEASTDIGGTTTSDDALGDK